MWDKAGVEKSDSNSPPSTCLDQSRDFGIVLLFLAHLSLALMLATVRLATVELGSNEGTARVSNKFAREQEVHSLLHPATLSSTVASRTLFGSSRELFCEVSHCPVADDRHPRRRHKVLL